jgi:hypothetical protein
MTEADKKYMAYDKQKEEHQDPYEFFAKQIKGLIAWVIIMVGVFMIIAAVLK